MPHYRVEALARGLRILSVFSEGQRSLRITDIARLSGLPVPTAFRLLRTLEEEGFIERGTDSVYVPGVAVLSLGFAALRSSSVVEAADKPLRDLAASTGETVNLAVLVASEILYLQRILNTDLVIANLQLGSRLPACCTSMGKLLLACLPEAQLRERVDEAGLSACKGPRAARTFAELDQRLAEIRDRGWAMQDEEVAHGLRSIAAPVRDSTRRTVAAINIAVQASRFTPDQLAERLLPPLLATAQQISSRLGYTDRAQQDGIEGA